MSLKDEDKLWIVERMDALELRMAERMDAVELRIVERTAAQIETAETGLLTAFHDWASPAEKRLYSYRATIEAIGADLERPKLRVERLKNPPKPH